MNFFELLYPKFKFTKPIRLVEFFAGYGSQSLAMKYLGLDYESWRIVEWNYKSTEAYKYLHSQDDTDYSKELSDDEIRAFLFSMGISADWNKPMKKEQINRLKSKDLREISNLYAFKIERAKEVQEGTNREWLSEMTDEELAKWLSRIQDEASCIRDASKYAYEWLEWLKEENDDSPCRQE